MKNKISKGIFILLLGLSSQNIFAQNAVDTTTSGIAYAIQPVVHATDVNGNIDADITSNIVISSTGNGDAVLGGTTTVAAQSGKATFTNLKYTDPSDKATYKLNASAYESISTDNIESDIKATKYIFTTQPSPTTIPKGVTVDFTTDPVVKAVDANNHVDTDNTERAYIYLDPKLSTLQNDAVQLYDGVATFTGLTLKYNIYENIQLVIRSKDSAFSVTSDSITVDNIAPTITSTAITTATQNSAYAYVLTGGYEGIGDLNWSVSDWNITTNQTPSWLSISKGIISTVAGGGDSYDDDVNATSARIRATSVAVDSEGSLYLLDSNKIRKVDTNGIITTVAGNGNDGFSGDDGNATEAEFSEPSGVAVDKLGNLYIADSYNNRIRKVDTNGIITTVAGNGNIGFSGDDGNATLAELSYPEGIAVDKLGNLYIADSENYRIRKVDTNGIITTVAGNGNEDFSGDDGNATLAELSYPRGIAVDTIGNLYIADNRNHRIRKIDTNGIITTVAGIGSSGSSGDEGNATLAELSYPRAVAVDSIGNLYIADSGRKIRKVDTNEIITTVAGSGDYPNKVSNTETSTASDVIAAVSAQFYFTNGIAVDSLGNLYIPDSKKRTVSKVDTSILLHGTPSNADVGVHDLNLTLSDGNEGSTPQNFKITVANVNDAPTSAEVSFTIDEDTSKTFTANDFNFTDIDLNSSLDSIYITYLPEKGKLTLDNVNITQNQKVTKLDITKLKFTPAANGIDYTYFHFYVNDGDANSTYFYTANMNITPVADTPTITSTAIKTGTPESEYSYFLMGGDADGDALNWSITSGTTLPSWLKLSANSSIISTVAGNGSSGFSGDEGNATSAELRFPRGIALDKLGNLYIGDEDNNRIRRVDINGTITTVAGNGKYGFSGDEGNATLSALSSPKGVAVDSLGNLYIADTKNHRIRKVDTNGIITTVAGNGSSGFSGDEGNATSAQLMRPGSVVVDSLGNLYIVDTNNHRIRKVDTNKIITTVAGNGSIGSIGDEGNATSAELNYPGAIAVDSHGNIYIADSGNYKIRKVDTNGIITTIAGIGSDGSSGDTGNATLAELNYPGGIAVDSHGNIYISDSSNNKIKKVDTNGIITTVAGIGSEGFSGDAGNATSAELSYTQGIVVDSHGNIYISDASNNRIRKVVPVKLVGTPTSADVGVYDVNLTLSDGNGGSTTQNFTIKVANLNSAPTLNPIKNQTKIEDASDYNIDLNATDIDGDTISYKVTSSNNKIATVKIVNGVLVVSQVDNSYGLVKIRVEATANGQSSVQYFGLRITSVNDAPVITKIGDRDVFKDFGVKSVIIDASDVEGDDLNYSALASKSGIIGAITFKDNNMSIKSLEGVSGNTDITVSVTDGNKTSTKVFNFYISALGNGEDVQSDREIIKTVDDNKSVRIVKLSETQSIQTTEENSGERKYVVKTGDKNTTASSELVGSLVDILTDGVETSFNDIVNSIVTKVTALITGKSTQELSVDGKTTSSIIKGSGSSTVIKKDANNKPQIVTTFEKVTITAKSDGTAVQEIVNDANKTSVVSSPAGSQTQVDEDSNVEVTAGEVDDNNGRFIKAKVLTKADGTTVTEFISVKQTDSSDEQVVSTTFDKSTPLEAGSNVTIKNINSVLYIETIIELSTYRLIVE